MGKPRMVAGWKRTFPAGFTFSETWVKEVFPTEENEAAQRRLFSLEKRIGVNPDGYRLLGPILVPDFAIHGSRKYQIGTGSRLICSNCETLKNSGRSCFYNTQFESGTVTRIQN
jgi:hypothetical protein